MLLGYFFVRTIPLPPEEEEEGRAYLHNAADEERRLLDDVGDADEDAGVSEAL